MARKPKPMKPAPALADQARTRLEELVVTLQLPPGSVWSEAQLSDKLGIGRTPVREALQRLQTDYLVKIVPRFGAQVTDINVSQHLRLLEVRRVLERLITESAARRATPTDDIFSTLVHATTMKSKSSSPLARAIPTPRAPSRRRMPCRGASTTCITARPTTCRWRPRTTPR